MTLTDNLNKTITLLDAVDKNMAKLQAIPTNDGSVSNSKKKLADNLKEIKATLESKKAKIEELIIKKRTIDALVEIQRENKRIKSEIYYITN